MKNCLSTREEVKRFIQQWPDAGRYHVHFSGHGVENARVEIDMANYSSTDGKKTFDTSDCFGDCIVNTDGSLQSVHDLKEQSNTKYNMFCCLKSIEKFI